MYTPQLLVLRTTYGQHYLLHSLQHPAYTHVLDMQYTDMYGKQSTVGLRLRSLCNESCLLLMA